MVSVLLVVGLILATFLAFGSGKIGRIAVLVTATVVGILALLAISYALHVYTAEQLIESYIDKIAQAAGLSPYLAKAVAFLLVLPALGAFAWCFSASQQKRLTGRYVLAGLASMYFAALWFVTMDQKITRDGMALKCFVVREDQVVWRDIKFVGLDPETGRPCEAAKPHLLPVLAKLHSLLQSGRQLQTIDPAGRFFSPIGDPVVWYHERKQGEFDFYDAPGFDPKTGQPLVPVSKEVVERLERSKLERARIEADQRKAEAAEAERKAQQDRQDQESIAKAEAAEAERKAVLERQEQQAEVKVKTERQEEERLAAIRALVIGLPVNDPINGLGLSIIADRPNEQLDLLAAARLAGALSRAAPGKANVFPAIFAAGFVDDGHFSEVMSGKTKFLKEAGIFSRVRYLALGTVRSGCKGEVSVGKVRNCVIGFSFKIFGEGGYVVASDSMSEIGPGFSDDAATQRGVELMVERQGNRFFQAIGR